LAVAERLEAGKGRLNGQAGFGLRKAFLAGVNGKRGTATGTRNHRAIFIPGGQHLMVYE
jgi:hypothetical protein